MSVETVNNVATVTITIEEYFDLRTKAEQSLYLSNELGRMEARFSEIDRRFYELEIKLMEKK